MRSPVTGASVGLVDWLARHLRPFERGPGVDRQLRGLIRSRFIAQILAPRGTAQLQDLFERDRSTEVPWDLLVSPAAMVDFDHGIVALPANRGEFDGWARYPFDGYVPGVQERLVEMRRFWQAGDRETASDPSSPILAPKQSEGLFAFKISAERRRNMRYLRFACWGVAQWTHRCRDPDLGPMLSRIVADRGTRELRHAWDAEYALESYLAHALEAGEVPKRLLGALLAAYFPVDVGLGPPRAGGDAPRLETNRLSTGGGGWCQHSSLAPAATRARKRLGVVARGRLAHPLTQEASRLRAQYD